MEAKKKDRQQEQQDRRQEEQDEQQELLDYAIEYCTCESYPPGLTKDKKRAVRKKAKSVLVEGGEVYIMKKKKKVHTYNDINIKVQGYLINPKPPASHSWFKAKHSAFLYVFMLFIGESCDMC